MLLSYIKYYSLIISIAAIFLYLLVKIDIVPRRYYFNFTLIIGIIYFSFRIFSIPTNTIPSFILGLILLAAELLGLVQFLYQRVIFKYPAAKKIPHKSEEFTVSILICTYNEPIHLVKKTMIAAKQIDYPTNKLTVYVLDDGHRDALKYLCKIHDIQYLTRKDNNHAKAGNINHALKIINTDLFAVLDADMIPTKNFLSHTVYLFKNKQVAFVQTPQVYYNKDMYQRNFHSNIPNEQDFFMKDIQEGKLTINSVLHVGTNVIFRKSYVESVGYYPTDSITEDMALGLKLHELGYIGEFVKENLVYGLSAETFQTLVIQRDRWCRGNLQVIKKYPIIKNKGLTFMQKWSYFDGTIYWFTSIQKLIYLSFPLFYFIFGIQIINSNWILISSLIFPYIICQIFSLSLITGSIQSFIRFHFYDTSMSPHVTASIIKEMLHLKTHFKVTPKDNVQKSFFQLQTVLPHILLVLAIKISLDIGKLRLAFQNIDIGSYLLNLFWILYNVIALIISIKVAYHQPDFHEERMIKLDHYIYANIYYDDNKIPVLITKSDVEYLIIRCDYILPDYFIIEIDDIGIMNAKLINQNDNSSIISITSTNPIIHEKLVSIYSSNLKAYYDK